MSEKIIIIDNFFTGDSSGSISQTTDNEEVNKILYVDQPDVLVSEHAELCNENAKLKDEKEFLNSNILMLKEHNEILHRDNTELVTKLSQTNSIISELENKFLISENEQNKLKEQLLDMVNRHANDSAAQHENIKLKAQFEEYKNDKAKEITSLLNIIEGLKVQNKTFAINNEKYLVTITSLQLDNNDLKEALQQQRKHNSEMESTYLKELQTSIERTKKISIENEKLCRQIEANKKFCKCSCHKIVYDDSDDSADSDGYCY